MQIAAIIAGVVDVTFCSFLYYHIRKVRDPDMDWRLGEDVLTELRVLILFSNFFLTLL